MSASSGSILIVDPAPMVREPLAAALQAAGFLTLAAGDGEEALEVAGFCPTSMILLDLDLPKLDGVELLRRLREDPNHADTPAVLLIEGTDLSRVQQAVALGARDYLIKSRFTMAALQKLIDKHCPPPEAVEAPPEPEADANTQAGPISGIEVAGDKVPGGNHPRAARVVHAPIVDDAVLKTLKPLIDRPQIDDVIERAHDLPVLAWSKQRLTAALGDGDTTIADVVEIARHDPTLTLHLLREANLADRFGDAPPTASLEAAAARLGLDAVAELISRLETWRLPGDGGVADFDGAGFWQHAVAVAQLAADLTRLAGGRPEEVETAATAGLVHDAGRLLMARHLGPRYAEVVETAEGLQTPLLATEAHLLLETHATLLDKTLRSWNVGPELANPVGLHHHDVKSCRHLAGASVGLLRALKLADALAHALLLGHCGDDEVETTDALVQAMGLDAAALGRALETLPDHVDQARRLVLPAEVTAGAGDDVSGGRRLLKDLDPTPRPLYIGLDPAADALAYLVKALNPAAAPPNVAVVHVRTVRERDAVTGQLQTAEMKAGLGKLPLVLVSPRGNIELDASASLGRSIRLLATPLPPRQLVKAMTRLLPRAEAAA
ncbi:MAG: HDOD domain-containing protein [Planctomycetota bacterium]